MWSIVWFLVVVILTTAIVIVVRSGAVDREKADDALKGVVEGIRNIFHRKES